MLGVALLLLGQSLAGRGGLWVAFVLVGLGALRLRQTWIPRAVQQAASFEVLGADVFGLRSVLRSILEDQSPLGLERLQIYVAPQAQPLCLCLGLRDRSPRWIVSEGLLRKLNREELRSLCELSLGHILAQRSFLVSFWITLTALIAPRFMSQLQPALHFRGDRRASSWSGSNWALGHLIWTKSPWFSDVNSKNQESSYAFLPSRIIRIQKQDNWMNPLSSPRQKTGKFDHRLKNLVGFHPI